MLIPKNYRVTFASIGAVETLAVSPEFAMLNLNNKLAGMKVCQIVSRLEELQVFENGAWVWVV